MKPSGKPDKWDLSVDFVSIGSGIGGLSGAITAHEQGLSAVVLEKSGLAGGVTAYSYGQVWVAANHLQAAAGIDDSQESGYRYCEWLAMGFADEQQIRNYIVHSPIALEYFEDRAGLRWRICSDFADYYWPDAQDTVREGRFLEVEPFPATTLGEWQALTRSSPHGPVGFTHDDMFSQGGAANIRNWDFGLLGERLEKDERCLGPGLAASFVKATLDRDIPIHLNTPAVALISEAGRVIGVQAERDGHELYIEARKGVLIATSSYDGNTQFEQLYDHRPSYASAVPRSVSGDNLKLGGAVGAQVGQVPTPHLLGFHIPGEEHDDGQPLWRGSIVETGLPHGIVVNKAGRRFGDEAFYRSIGHNCAIIDAKEQTLPNMPCWFVFDSQYHAKYPLGSVLPGQEYPEGLAAKADTIEDLAHQLGIDAPGLVSEIERFNGYARDGEDPEFKRGDKAWSQFMCGDRAHKPNPCLGTIEQAPFYAIEQGVIGVGMVSAGLVADVHGRVLGYDDEPIEGLYVAGNAMARLENGAGYQSGQMNGRGMVFGYLAARHASGDPSRELDATVTSSG